MPSTPSAPPGSAAPFSPAYTRYLLFALLLVMILNVLDRQVINVLAEPIKQELGLSDTQLGLLTGLAFALFYNVVGIPLGRLADNARTNRVTLISASLAVWSGMTALCGAAQTFGHILLARIGVAAGEAGCVPPAHSLIADTVPLAKRARALAIFGLGVPIGALLGKAMGGVLADAFGWRSAFLIVGVPGVLLAALLFFTVREPRKMRLASAGPAAERIPLREVVAEIRRSPVLVNLTLAVSTASLLVTGGSVWGMVHFIRNHHLTPGTAGVWIGLSGGIAGSIGTWLGGVVADRYGVRDPRHYMTAPILGMVLTVPLLLLAWHTNNWMLAIALLFLPDMFDNLYYGGVFAAVQSLVSDRTRATATATMLFVMTLVGTGFGALSFGFASDLLKPFAGEGESVRWVLMGAAVLYLVPAYFYWRASRHIRREFAALRAAEAPTSDS
ncbi:spinster family MFS transporter [Phenylobacterium sp. VNQ135]|uniref:spinster family MFS transporter n=1 Tax=Phenylobacterium sp. VNQ135 TaxID=3400922 RepID=UPI003BFB2A06